MSHHSKKYKIFNVYSDDVLFGSSKCVFSTLGKRTKMFGEMVNKMVMLNKNGQGLF